MRKGRRLLIIGATAAAPLALLPTRGIAQPAPCTVSVGGVELDAAPSPQSAISVSPDVPLQVSVKNVTDLKAVPRVQLELSGIRWTLSRLAPVEGGFEGKIQIQKYDVLGAGLYKFVVDTPESEACSGSAFVNVDRAPLSTLAGTGAALVAVIGLALLALTARPSRRARRELTEAVWARGQLSWRPRVSPLGLLGGLMASGGVLILLQQFAALYPSLLVTITAIVLGVVLGLAVPSIGQGIVLRRANLGAEED